LRKFATFNGVAVSYIRTSIVPETVLKRTIVLFADDTSVRQTTAENNPLNPARQRGGAHEMTVRITRFSFLLRFGPTLNAIYSGYSPTVELSMNAPRRVEKSIVNWLANSRYGIPTARPGGE
jgi:hypothetical protein